MGTSVRGLTVIIIFLKPEIEKEDKKKCFS